MSLTNEQLLAQIQANMSKLFSRLDEIHGLVTGRTKEHHTVAEAAEMFGRSAYTIRRWIAGTPYVDSLAFGHRLSTIGGPPQSPVIGLRLDEQASVPSRIA